MQEKLENKIHFSCKKILDEEITNLVDVNVIQITFDMHRCMPADYKKNWLDNVNCNQAWAWAFPR